MTIDKCIEVIVEAYNQTDFDKYTDWEDLKADLKKMLKKRANLDIDFRTRRGREILKCVKKRLNIQII